MVQGTWLNGSRHQPRMRIDLASLCIRGRLAERLLDLVKTPSTHIFTKPMAKDRVLGLRGALGPPSQPESAAWGGARR